MDRKYGNAQTIGRNVNQNTYFLTRQGKECFLVLMADGTIDSVNGAYAAVLACETAARGMLWEENIAMHENALQAIAMQLETQFEKAAQVLRERIYKGKQPRVSLLAAYFYKNTMYYRCIGNIGIAAYDGKQLTLLKGVTGTYEAGAHRILIASQGVWQALNEVEIEHILSGHEYPYGKAQKLIEEVNHKNLKEQKSTAAVIVE